MHLHGAQVDDFVLHLGQAAIIGVSRAIEQTFFFPFLKFVLIALSRLYLTLI